MNDRDPLALTASHLLTPAEIAVLAAAFDRVTLLPPGQAYACPSDDGSADTVTFVYATGPDVRIIRDHQGCRFISNGAAYGYSDDRVNGELDARLTTPKH